MHSLLHLQIHQIYTDRLIRILRPPRCQFQQINAFSQKWDKAFRKGQRVSGAKPRAGRDQAGCPRQRIRSGSAGTFGCPMMPRRSPR